jgi:hypothetical protein
MTMFPLQPAQLTEERRLVFPASFPSSTGTTKIVCAIKTPLQCLSSEDLLITFRSLQRVFIALQRLFAKIKNRCNVYHKFRRVIDNI